MTNLQCVLPRAKSTPFLQQNLQNKFFQSTSEGGDRGGLWYRYQLIRYQVPPKLKVLVPPIFGEGAFMNMTNSGRRSTSVPHETNGQDQTTPEHVTVASVSLSAL